jgi:ankyrin repeat protein
MIHFAAQRGNIALLYSLSKLPFTVEVNIPDTIGQTALYYAVQSKRVDAISTLVVAGANLHAVDARGKTLLQRAKEMNKSLAINFLEDMIQEDTPILRTNDVIRTRPGQSATV